MQVESTKWWVYGLVDPRTDQVRYVGVTNDVSYRHRHHIFHARSRDTAKDRWISGLLDIGLWPTIKVLEYGDSDDRLAAERRWIASYAELFNSSEGGQDGRRIRATTEEGYARRFWSKVNKSSGNFALIRGVESECWEWAAGKNSKNYGYFWYHNHSVQAHQVAWKFDGNDQPYPMELDHLCRNTICVRPLHLELVSRAVNQLRSPLTIGGANFRKSDCPKGHPLSGDNLYIIPSSGARSCKECARERLRQWIVNNRDQWRTYHRDRARIKRAEQTARSTQ